jgi:hypothetical protein
MKGLEPMENTTLKKMIEIDHEGATYSIGDLIASNNPDSSIDYNEAYCKLLGYTGNMVSYVPNRFSNRAVFSVLSSLFNQVAADPKNLPTQQLIQVQ